MRILCFIAALLSLAGCRKFDEDSIQNLNGGKIDIVGHGGMGFESLTNPNYINSENSILLALEGLFADGCEVDVQMSADSVLFLYHDEQLDSETACTGCIANSTSDQIEQCPYSGGINDLGGEQQHIITLEYILSRYASMSEPPSFYLDTKTANFCDAGLFTDLDAMALKINELIVKYDAIDWVFVESRSEALLNKVLTLNRKIKTIFDVDDVTAGIVKCQANGYIGVAASNARITKEQITAAHNAGLTAHIFNVRSASAHRAALDKWPDSIQTDNIELLQNMLLE